jgi:hypothetical protein
MTLERGAHKGRPYAMSIPVATLVVALLPRLRIEANFSKFCQSMGA